VIDTHPSQRIRTGKFLWARFGFALPSKTSAEQCSKSLQMEVVRGRIIRSVSNAIGALKKSLEAPAQR